MTESTATKPSTAEAAAQRFRGDTTEHRLEILHDDGLYRHLRFKQPGTMMMHFDLITWPGCLTIAGDVGTTYTFRRLPDMFEFFRGPVGRINAGYWAEKLVSNEGSAKEFAPDVYRQHVQEWAAEQAEHLTVDREREAFLEQVEDELLNEEAVGHKEAAQQAIRDFRFHRDMLPRKFGSIAHEPIDIEDWWEWDLTEYGFWFQWACHAIVWGIDQYDKARAEQGPQRPARVDLDALFADLRTEVRSSFPNAPLVTAAQEAIERRLRWASLHWGTPGVHPDAWPHIAAAACEGVEQYARALGSERTL